MITEDGIDPRIPIGELVAERSVRAALFEELGLDYCCGGRQTLAQACARRGLALNEVLVALEAIEHGGDGDADIENRDWRTASIAELCAHIVAVHHDGLRRAFPRIEQLFATVVRVHADRDPSLREAQRWFGELRAELEPHLASEEQELFPACIGREQTGTPVDEALLSEHEREHAVAGDALAALRVLCRDYDRTAALCATHRALLDELEAFEQDLHRHVHEENNVLMPRSRPAAPAGGRPQSQPTCCEGWIGEQVHAWSAHRHRSGA